MTMAFGLETLCFFALSAVLIISAFLVWLGVRFDKEQQRKSTIGIQDEVKVFKTDHLRASSGCTMVQAVV